MPKLATPTRLKILAIVILSLIVLSQTQTIRSVFADDPCDHINDLDDRAKCYENEIEEKEEEYESTSKKLDDIRGQKDSVEEQIAGLLGQLNVTQAEINSLQNQINEMTAALEEINATLVLKNEQLQEKIAFRNKVIRNYTKRGVLNDLEMFFTNKEALSLNGFQYSSLSYMFEKSLTGEFVNLISYINTEISNYEKDKKEAEELKTDLEVAQAALLAAKTEIETKKASEEENLNVLAGKEEDYEEELKSISEKINDLSGKQQDILRQKFGDGYVSIGDYEQGSWSVPDPPFGNAYGFFSYGAYTHYRGMSQYGARGRAKDGQDYKEIIEFYYGKEVKKKDDLPDKICVEGYGEMDFQYYLYGLAEMPSDWDSEALKAQAVAGRTYAYRYHKAGNCICTSQSCQVFLKSKADNPPSKWKDAVDDTKKRIIDGDTHAMYSSTTGGYIDDGIGWDLDGSNWPGDAYEKKGGSPWFYWAWYSQNYRFDSSTCGRGHPWLDEEEMADILNSWVVWDKGSSSDRDRISPVTTSCWGGDPYSHDKMADKADGYGKKFTSVSDAWVDIGSNGRTSKVYFRTNRGEVSIDGEEFKTVFNLRAPGYVSIRSRLFDVQHEN